MGNRLSKIYTRTGDDGTTGLGNGDRVAKDSRRVEAYGTVDELNSLIGLALAEANLTPEIESCLTLVQHELFDLGGELCIPGTTAITAKSVVRLEKELKRFRRITLKPGEKRTLTFPLDKDTFAFYDDKTDKWIVEPGDFTILAGSSSADIRISEILTLK